MERICEPELMEGLEQARAYGAADFSATDQALVERLAELLGPTGQLEPLRIVDLGCGPGNISFRLVERFARAQVLGLDGAAAMLDLAAEGLDRHPDWRPRLSFRSALLPLGPGLAQELAGGAGAGFGVVVSNSLLHHLHGPQVLWRTVRQLGAPGALVLIRDLRRPATPRRSASWCSAMPAVPLSCCNGTTATPWRRPSLLRKSRPSCGRPPSPS